MYTMMNPVAGPLLGQLLVSGGEASLESPVETTTVYTNIGNGSSASGLCEQPAPQQVAAKPEGEDRYVMLH